MVSEVGWVASERYGCLEEGWGMGGLKRDRWLEEGWVACERDGCLEEG
jgi:hypothetical protein